MDLALELGMPVGSMKATMTTRELGMWSVYAAKKGLPSRRRELYLAQIARMTGGGELDDYLLDHRRARVGTVNDAAAEISQMAGGMVVRVVKG